MPAKAHSLSRLLQAPIVVSDARPLVAPDPSFDPAMVTALEAAYARGRRDGQVEGRATGTTEARSAMTAVQAALQRTVAACAAARQHESAEVVALAAAIARVVVGREPVLEGAALLARVREALELIDDPTITVAAAPSDVEALSAGLADIVGMTVTPDPSLSSGEARVVGRWASAALTRESGWAAVRELLEEQA